MCFRFLTTNTKNICLTYVSQMKRSIELHLSYAYCIWIPVVLAKPVGGRFNDLRTVGIGFVLLFFRFIFLLFGIAFVPCPCRNFGDWAWGRGGLLVVRRQKRHQFLFGLGRGLAHQCETVDGFSKSWNEEYSSKISYSKRKKSQPAVALKAAGHDPLLQAMISNPIRNHRWHRDISNQSTSSRD